MLFWTWAFLNLSIRNVIFFRLNSYIMACAVLKRLLGSQLEKQILDKCVLHMQCDMHIIEWLAIGKGQLSFLYLVLHLCFQCRCNSSSSIVYRRWLDLDADLCIYWHLTPLKLLKLHGCGMGRRAISVNSVWPVLVFMGWGQTFNILEFCTGKQFVTQVIQYVFVKELTPDCVYFCQSWK